MRNDGRLWVYKQIVVGSGVNAWDALYLYRNGNTNGYTVGMLFYLKDSAGSWEQYADIAGVIYDNTAGFEAGYLRFRAKYGGSMASSMIVYGGDRDFTGSLDSGTSVSVANLYYLSQTAGSRYELKENIVDADENVLSGLLDDISLKFYNFKGNPKKHVGFVIEELAKKHPELDFLIVRDSEGRPIGYNPDELVMCLIAKIKKLEREIKELRRNLK